MASYGSLALPGNDGTHFALDAARLGEDIQL
jgi:hypothetical protein